MSETPQHLPSLVRKLAAVMGEVERIPKSGRNDFHKYDYATEADIVAAVRKGLAERGVMIVHKVDALTWRQSTKSSGEPASPIATVHVTFSAIDGDSGETLVVAQTVGEGQDSGDKAVYKALTGALKYAILKLFLIPTGHDPEASKKPRDQRDPHPESGSRPEHSGGAPTHFPKFGKGNGAPIRDAAPAVLEFHIEQARKSLADPQKAKWHAKESALIGALEAELARQRGAAVTKAIVNGPPDPAGPPPPKAPSPAYHDAVKVGTASGWLEDNVKHWLKAKRGKSAASEVTAEDVAELRKALEPPPKEEDAPF